MSVTTSRGSSRGRFSTGGRAPPPPLVDRVPRGPYYSLISLQHVQKFFTNDKSLDRLGRFLNEHILGKDVDLESCRVVLQAVKNVRYHDKGPLALLAEDNELDDKVMTENPDLWEGRTPCYGCDSNDKILGGCNVPDSGAGLGLDENYYGDLTTCLNCWIRGKECEYMPAEGEGEDEEDEDKDQDDEGDKDD